MSTRGNIILHTIPHLSAAMPPSMSSSTQQRFPRLDATRYPSRPSNLGPDIWSTGSRPPLGITPPQLPLWWRPRTRYTPISSLPCYRVGTLTTTNRPRNPLHHGFDPLTPPQHGLPLDPVHPSLNTVCRLTADGTPTVPPPDNRKESKGESGLVLVFLFFCLSYK